MTIEMEHCPAADCLVGALQHEKLVIVDAGCGKTGVPRIWTSFGSKSQAFGFDSSQQEIERLVSSSSNSVRYHAALLGIRPDHPYLASLPAVRSGDPYDFTRNAAWYRAMLDRGTELSPLSALSEMPLPTGVPVTPPRMDSGERDFKELLIEIGVENIDVLKVDIDSSDALLLRSLGRSISDWGILAIKLEIMFSARPGAHQNILDDSVDYLRQFGLDLWDMHPTYYASRALPTKFRYPAPTSNLVGRVVWADMLFIRDVCGPGALSLTTDKLLKAAAILAVFDKPDWAAEILSVHESRMPDHFDATQAMALLEAQARGDGYPQLYRSAWPRPWVNCMTNGSVSERTSEAKIRPQIRDLSDIPLKVVVAGQSARWSQQAKPNDIVYVSLDKSRGYIMRPFVGELHGRVTNHNASYFLKRL